MAPAGRAASAAGPPVPRWLPQPAGRAPPPRPPADSSKPAPRYSRWGRIRLRRSPIVLPDPVTTGSAPSPAGVRRSSSPCAKGRGGRSPRRAASVGWPQSGLHTRAGAGPAGGRRRDRRGPIAADLVVDANGRRSPVPDWLEAAGAARPVAGSRRLRHRVLDAVVPAAPGCLVPGLVRPADDAARRVRHRACARRRRPLQHHGLRGRREPQVHGYCATLTASCACAGSRTSPAAWVDPEVACPVGSVAPMPRAVDQRTSYVVDGRPCASGLSPSATPSPAPTRRSGGARRSPSCMPSCCAEPLGTIPTPTPCRCATTGRSPTPSTRGSGPPGPATTPP